MVELSTLRKDRISFQPLGVALQSFILDMLYLDI
jgi:hypothetical protein